MLFANAPPAEVNHPPATRSPFGSVVRASTRGATPEPKADQLVPFPRRMLAALPPPADVKYPPATTSPFGSVVRAMTLAPNTWLIPEPSADQLVPFQRAIQEALTPPA